MDPKNTANAYEDIARIESLLTRESWKIFQIMAEFADGFEHLASIKPSVSIFGSARSKPEHPYYQKAEEIAKMVSAVMVDTSTG